VFRPLYYILNCTLNKGDDDRWQQSSEPSSSVHKMLAWLVRRSRLTLAIAAFRLVVALSAIVAFWTLVSDWHGGRKYGASSPKRSVPPTHQTVVYGKAADGKQLVLDVWHARGESEGKPNRAIVRVHGGGWDSGARGEFNLWNEWLSTLGYDVFDIDYRLPPPVRWQEEVGDVKCAIGWVATNAKKYGIDLTRISVMGESAGGNLALLAAYSMGDSRVPPSCESPQVKIRSVINLYGPTDMARAYAMTGGPYLRSRMVNYIGGPPSEFPSRYYILSPINYINEHTPPTITLHGATDRIVPPQQAVILDKALTAAGVDHETYLFPDAGHGFDRVWNGITSQIARAKIEDFLERQDR
jgi:acetyl esterase/lipase